VDEPLSSTEAPRAPCGIRSGTLERIRKIFVQSMRLNVPEQDLPYERMLEEAAILDSIAVLEFVTALESEFGISLESEFLNFDFLRDLPGLASFIEERTAGHPGSEPPGECA